MADFQNDPVPLHVDALGKVGNQSVGAEAAFPRALQISVSDAQQVFPPDQHSTVNTVFLFAGIVRFGQDIGQDDDAIIDDPDNVFAPDLEVDDGIPKTLYLALRTGQQQQFRQLNSAAGSASFAALCRMSLDTTDVFGADIGNAHADLTNKSPIEGSDPNSLAPDFYLFSDVFAEKHCQLSRLGYQATVLLQTQPQSLATPEFQELPIKHVGSVIDLDVADSNQVASPGGLDVGIADGLQVFGLPVDGDVTNGANRLLIFTGNALCNFVPVGENFPSAAVVRVRLRFPLPSTLLLKGSATVAALASIHGNEHQPALFGVNAARIVTDPTDGGTVLPPPPGNELYLLAELRAQGAEDDDGNLAGVSRFTYQANVLVQDTTPDLDSILVRPAGVGSFAQDATIELSGGADGFYDIQLNLTGPPPPNFTVSLESSDPQNVFAGPLVVLTAQQTEILNNLVLSNTKFEDVTITATGQRRIRTATLQIRPIT